MQLSIKEGRVTRKKERKKESKGNAARNEWKGNDCLRR